MTGKLRVRYHFPFWTKPVRLYGSFIREIDA